MNEMSQRGKKVAGPKKGTEVMAQEDSEKENKCCVQMGTSESNEAHFQRRPLVKKT